MNPSIAIAAVFIGCCSNLVFLELLITESPSSGNLITFVQFVFISFEGLFFTSKFFTKKPTIPISMFATMASMHMVDVMYQNVLHLVNVSIPIQLMLRTYIFMVAQFFIVNVANNYALNFNIPMPLHLIFRSLHCIKIRLRGDDHSWHHLGDSCVSPRSSILLLLFALYMSARMGIYQETVYAQFGKHPSEALFYNHFLPLPAFLFLSKDIYNHMIVFSQSTPIVLPFLGIAVPKLWLFLIGNTLTHPRYVCIRSVFILTTECTSLSVTLVVTLRKFLSLLFSIIYFNNPFTLYHWLGTAFVFSGTLLFTDAFSLLNKAYSHMRTMLSEKKKTA
ncbi:hypothetical protein NP493_1188g00036 [Ridgeia piscesae]|uniref:Uncharacterized protein n=1 Tax=Ridgeia piscesae TaxID=27915 RepID=A0AAD9KE30_RIDPI|nr:hypothetical protein NP493_1188g00036 [Ridgeia piscesae]